MNFSNTAIFSPRTVALLVSVGLIAFFATLVVAAFSDPVSPHQRTGANSYSSSAIGHFGFVELLRRSGLPVLVSRNRSPEKSRSERCSDRCRAPGRVTQSREIDYMLRAHRVLVVLPKWAGTPSAENRNWLSQAALKQTGNVDAILKEVHDADLWRPPSVGRLVASIAGQVPEIAHPQLIKSGDIEPIVETTNGVLVGRLIRGGATVWLLSDPDILSNHGLSKGDNAALALAIITELRGPGGAVVIDETLHGFRIDPSLIRTLFSLPFVVATILLAVSIGVLVWAAGERFGSPQPAPAKQGTGKFTLIDNIAALLSFGGDHVEITRRFLKQITRHVAQVFHVPHHLRDDQRTAWLDRIGATRKVTNSLRNLEQEARILGRNKRSTDRDIAGFAARTHRWKQEMMHGPERNPED